MTKTKEEVLREKAPRFVLFQGIDNDVITAMDTYADIRLAEYKETLKQRLIEANKGSKYPMTNAQLFIDLIEKP